MVGFFHTLRLNSKYLVPDVQKLDFLSSWIFEVDIPIFLYLQLFQSDVFIECPYVDD